MVGAWRTAGQEETGTATTRESHSGPAGEGSTTLWGPAARSATASDKSVLELGRRHMVPSQMLHHGGLWLDNAWCEDGGGSPVGHASLSNNSEAHPIRHEWSFSSQVGEHLGMEARSFNATCSKKTRALLSYGLPWVSPALRLSGAMSGQHLHYSLL